MVLPNNRFARGAAKKAASLKRSVYALLSLWPINKHNGPVTEAEAAGLQFVAIHPEQGYYREGKVGGERYLTAMYADKAISGPVSPATTSTRIVRIETSSSAVSWECRNPRRAG